ncbi:hypothetical protein ABIA95_002663 [Bradyrhizobium sp. LA8.1]
MWIDNSLIAFKLAGSRQERVLKQFDGKGHNSIRRTPSLPGKKRLITLASPNTSANRRFASSTHRR